MKKQILLLAFTSSLFFAEAQSLLVSQSGVSPALNNRNLRSAAYEPEVKTIDIPGRIQLEYVEQGDPSGIPVIFLHGLTDSWHSFEETLKFLPPHVHAMALTQRGHGHSEKPESGYLPYDFSEDLAAFLITKKTGPALIVGHSMGATIAQRFAMDHPELVSGLVLLGAVPQFRVNPGVLGFRNEVLALTDPVEYSFAEAFQKSTITKPMDPVYFDTLVRESLKLPARVWKAALDGLMEVDYTSNLRGFKKKTLILYGDRDEFSTIADQKKLNQAIEGSQLKIYKNTGHAIHWDRPREVANDLLKIVDQIKLTPVKTAKKS